MSGLERSLKNGDAQVSTERFGVSCLAFQWSSGPTVIRPRQFLSANTEENRVAAYLASKLKAQPALAYA